MNEQGTLAALRKDVLAIHDEVDAGQVCQAIDKIDAYKRAIKEIDATFKQALIEWINRNGEVTLGTKRYYVGTTTKTTARDLERLTEAAITACQGDFGRFCEALSSNAYKPGKCREILGDDWGIHFYEEVVKDVKSGKPKKDVKMIDERFVK